MTTKQQAKVEATVSNVQSLMKLAKDEAQAIEYRTNFMSDLRRSLNPLCAWYDQTLTREIVHEVARRLEIEA